MANDQSFTYLYRKKRWARLFRFVDAVGGRFSRPMLGAPDYSRAERILVLKLDQMGDLILTQPLLAALRRAAPRARIEIAVGEGRAVIARRFAEVDAVREFPVRQRPGEGGTRFPIRPMGSAVRAARAMRPDVIVVAKEEPFTILLARIIGAPVRVGFRERGLGFLLTHAVSAARGRHQYEVLAALAGAGGDPIGLPRFPLSEADREAADRFLRALAPPPDLPLVMVHPGSGIEARRWPWTRFIATLLDLAATTPACFLVVRGDESLPVDLPTLPIPSRCTAHGERMDLGTFAAVLERADLLLGNESGPSHLASAVGTPAVVPFLSGNPHATWGPADASSVVVPGPPGIGPPPERVVAAVRRVLARRPRSRAVGRRRAMPRVAIVADYLNQHGGAEWVVAVFHTMFPEAPVFTPILDRGSLWSEMAAADIRVSWMQRLPGLKRHFRKYFLLYPGAIEGFDLRDYDLVLSSSCAYGKGARAGAGAVHVCYCHTPARFIWNYAAYVERERIGPVARAVLPPLIRAMKAWDLRTAGNPDVYVANSNAVADRIRRFYGRDAAVIPPPIDCRRFAPSAEVEPYGLVVSRLIPYKRIDLAVDAFTLSGLPLRIVGDGPDRPALERRAGPSVTFLGRLPDADVARLLARCSALIHPGLEDFGLAPLEANAAGRPVIAFRGGGAIDTVVDGMTGVFFDEQAPQALVDAVDRAREMQWDGGAIRRHALRFDLPEFRARMYDLLSRAVGTAVGPEDDAR